MNMNSVYQALPLEPGYEARVGCSFPAGGAFTTHVLVHLKEHKGVDDPYHM